MSKTPYIRIPYTLKNSEKGTQITVFPVLEPSGDLKFSKFQIRKARKVLCPDYNASDKMCRKCVEWQDSDDIRYIDGLGVIYED